MNNQGCRMLDLLYIWNFDCLAAIMAHASGALLHAYFILDAWDCWLYWWIFSLTACLPLCFDIASIIVNFCIRDMKYKQQRQVLAYVIVHCIAFYEQMSVQVQRDENTTNLKPRKQMDYKPQTLRP